MRSLVSSGNVQICATSDATATSQAKSARRPRRHLRRAASPTTATRPYPPAAVSPRSLFVGRSLRRLYPARRVTYVVVLTRRRWTFRRPLQLTFASLGARRETSQGSVTFAPRACLVQKSRFFHFCSAHPFEIWAPFWNVFAPRKWKSRFWVRAMSWNVCEHCGRRLLHVFWCYIWIETLLSNLVAIYECTRLVGAFEPWRCVSVLSASLYCGSSAYP